jgi:hypothetical protein
VTSTFLFRPFDILLGQFICRLCFVLLCCAVYILNMKLELKREGKK